MLCDLVYTIICEYISEEKECIKILEYFREDIRKYDYIFKEYDHTINNNKKVRKLIIKMDKYCKTIPEYKNLVILKMDFGEWSFLETAYFFESGNNKFQDSLYMLEINYYNGKLKAGILPNNLHTLILKGFFNTKIYKGALPDGLHTLYLNKFYDQIIEPNILPKFLVVLKFFGLFNKKFEKDILPKTLQILKLSKRYDKLIEPNIIPDSVKTIYISKNYQYYDQLKRIYHNIEIILF